MIRIRFFDPFGACLYESMVFTAQFPRGLNKSGQWSANVPLTRVLYDLLGSESYAELWYNDTYCIGGKVQTVPVKFDADTVIEIKGREELDVLYDAPADTGLYINNKSFLLQLFTLLNESGWRLGRYEDIDRTRLITYDARKEKQRVTLFNALLKLEPKLKYRFGGFDIDGQPMLDVSEFDDTFKYQVLPASPGEQANQIVIQDTQTVDDYTTHLYAIEVLGGDMTDNLGVKRPVRLGDLINFTTLRFDLNYPVYEEQAEQKYVIVPATEGNVGGRVTCNPSAVHINTAIIGETSGTSIHNRWAAFLFHPYPGVLVECSFWSGPAINLSFLKATESTNPLRWELREVDELNVIAVTAQPLLASGIVPNAAWGSNQRVRFAIPNITVARGKRYMLRVGFLIMPTAGCYLQVRSVAANASKSFRLDFMQVNGAAVNNIHNQAPVFEALTVGVQTGRRATEYQTQFLPQKESGNAPLLEIQSAALSMYEWAKIQLINTIVNRHDILVNLAGFRLDWRPGDVLYVLAQTQFIEGNRSAWESRTIESLDYSFSDSTPKTAVKFLPNIPIEDDDDNVVLALFDKQNKKKVTVEGRSVEPLWAWELTELSSVIQYKVPDTNLTDGTPAVTVTFTLTPAPAGKFETRLLGTPYGIHSNTAVPIVVEVYFKSETTVICKVAIRDVGWSLYDQATIYCHQVWR